MKNLYIYSNKNNAIDQNKFKLITRNPVATLKTEVNKLIAAANKNNKPKVLNPIVGECSPGYILYMAL